MKSSTDIYNAVKNTEPEEVSRRDFMKFSATTAAVLGLAPVCLLTSCYQVDEGPDPFNNGTEERNLIVVISDLHMGADLEYAEIKANLGPLEHFLERIENSANVKELVINGDLLDEWFVPATVDTYEGYNQFDFVERIATANKDVITVLNRIIFAEKIIVTYVPGNHDLTITTANVENILPGIVQARDTGLLGLGTYTPTGCPQVAMEHGHRYNFFCAPDPISNKGDVPGSILPPGYFFTRIAALHVVQGCKSGADVVPNVTDPLTTVSQNLLYRYWKQWKWSLGIFPIKDLFSDSIIVTNVDGFTATYAINDLLPSQPGGVGPISVNLYSVIQDTWAQRCILNNVPVALDTGNAIDKIVSADETDRMASVQYFMNASSDKRIVVFGHSHVPTLFSSKNYKGEKTIYVNSGTWIDHNPNRTTTNFVVITPQSSDESSQTSVALYNFENEYVTEMARDSVRI